MPIFPFYQYPYNMNRYYQRNNIYLQKNNYNKQIDNKINHFEEDNTFNNELKIKNEENNQYNT